jgi:hypothetical protein
MKRIFTQEDKDLVLTYGSKAALSDIGRVLDAKLGSIFTILREHGGIKPEKEREQPLF